MSGSVKMTAGGKFKTDLKSCLISMIRILPRSTMLIFWHLKKALGSYVTLKIQLISPYALMGLGTQTPWQDLGHPDMRELMNSKLKWQTFIDQYGNNVKARKNRLPTRGGVRIVCRLSIPHFIPFCAPRILIF